jgi:N-acylglucosamine-6-phosphate 2-epimerase
VIALSVFRRLVEGRLIVSCQAPDGPLRHTPTMVRVAAAAVAGGAAAIRCGGVGGVADVRAIAAAVAVPVIGLTKSDDPEVYITPTVADAVAVAEAGATVVACDATQRPRPDGSRLADTIAAVHARGRLVMADVSALDEGLAAFAAGADIVATTLAGYTGRGNDDGPDLALVAALRAAAPDPLFVAEGRIRSPDVARAAVAAGASTVVVGTAITDPLRLTRAYAAAIASHLDRGPA